MGGMWLHSCLRPILFSYWTEGFLISEDELYILYMSQPVWHMVRYFKG